MEPHFAFDEESAWMRCLTYFLEDAYDHSHSTETRRIYQQRLSRFFSMSAGNGPPKLPQNYTREDVEFYINMPSESRRNRGTPPSTAAKNQKLSVLKLFYEYAAQFTIAGSDGKPVPLFVGTPPTLGIKMGKARRRHYALSYAEMEAFFAAIPDSEQGSLYRALFLTYFWTGRRRNEILRLKWGDFSEGMIIENGVSRRAWMYRFFGKGKSQEEDMAEMPAPAMEAILSYLKKTGRDGQMTPDSPLFVAVYHKNGNGQLIVHDQQLSIDVAQKACKQIARAAGLDASRISIHVFRHTCATTRYETGVPLRDIQRLLRHASLATTESYIQSLIGTADSGAKLLESRFSRFSRA